MKIAKLSIITLTLLLATLLLLRFSPTRSYEIKNNRKQEGEYTVKSFSTERAFLGNSKILDPNTFEEPISTAVDHTEEKVVEWSKTVFKYSLGSPLSIEAIPTSQAQLRDQIQAIDLSESAPRAFSLRFTPGAMFEYSLDGTQYSGVTLSEEGGSDFNLEYQVSNLIYVPEEWDKILRLRYSSPVEVEVHVIPEQSKQGEVKLHTNATSAATYWGGATATTLPIVPRSIWGANPETWDWNSSLDINSPDRLNWYPEYYRIKGITIHHTATPHNVNNPAQAVRDIYMYHAYSNGWGDIGYNYLIDANGTIYEGKIGGEGTIGYHAYIEPNISTIGIGLIGDFTNSTPTSAALDSLARLLAEKAAFYNKQLVFTNGTFENFLSDSITVYGHRDTYFWCFPGHTQDYRCPSGSQWLINATACPGNQFHAIIASQVIPLANQYKDNGFTAYKAISLSVDAQFANSAQFAPGLLHIKDSAPINPTIFESQIPLFSGISQYSISGSSATLYINDWENGGDVAPGGWQGVFVDFYPAEINWRNERIKTLVKIFRLNGTWNYIGMQYNYSSSNPEK